VNQNIKVPVRQYLFDRTGMIASGLCAIHCIALPFFVSISLFSGWAFLNDERVELTFVFTSALIAVWSLVPSCINHHKRLTPLLILTAGLFIITLSKFTTESSEPILAFFGAALVTAAHLLNYRICKSISK
jgi:hypothetical protein